ncbi:hypothetical protein J6590_061239 [Homalodisca vitripennis]|nr:hypothetical protein J6590_061239 [Homalodisca vitripennis]
MHFTDHGRKYRVQQKELPDLKLRYYEREWCRMMRVVLFDCCVLAIVSTSHGLVRETSSALKKILVILTLKQNLKM